MSLRPPVAVGNPLLFCPRKLDFDPLASDPYHHSNLKSEEMLYYVVVTADEDPAGVTSYL